MFCILFYNSNTFLSLNFVLVKFAFNLLYNGTMLATLDFLLIIGSFFH